MAPITYCTLQPRHLDQVHDLLARVFWDGIDGMSRWVQRKAGV